MTGHLERPSQEALENRKAIERRRVRRRPTTPRAALRSLHAAERALLLASHRAAIAQKRAAIAAAFASMLTAAEQRIIDHVQGRIAAIDPNLSLSARMAEIGRLRTEQDAVLLRLRQDITAERRRALRAGIAALSIGYRRDRNALSGRQQADRAAVARIPHSAWAWMQAIQSDRRRPWPAVRALAVRILPNGIANRRGVTVGNKGT